MLGVRATAIPMLASVTCTVAPPFKRTYMSPASSPSRTTVSATGTHKTVGESAVRWASTLDTGKRQRTGLSLISLNKHHVTRELDECVIRKHAVCRDVAEESADGCSVLQRALQ